MTQNNAFAHYEAYARKGAHMRRSKKRRPSMYDIHAELTRAPGGCHHLENPSPPKLLYGLHPDIVIERAEALAAEAVGIRIDTPILLAGVLTWPVPREAVENSEEQRNRYLAWREDGNSWLREVWGDGLQSVVEHTDEGRLHPHFLVLPPLRPDRRLDIADVDFGRRAAKEVKEAGGSKLQQKEASDQAMVEFQDRYFRDVGSKHGLARLGPRRLRLTRQEWKDWKAELERNAEAWRTLGRKKTELQVAANAHVAAQVAEARQAAAAIAAAVKDADRRIGAIKTKATHSISEWRAHVDGLKRSIDIHKALIVDRDNRIEELEELLREHGLVPRSEV